MNPSFVRFVSGTYRNSSVAGRVFQLVEGFKTTAKGGYHHWHYETLAGTDSYSRELTWMVYLNDMPDGEAETEFLYQARKVKPTQGTVVIWPAGMTHVHRGNTVYTKDKYIATGWWYKT